jgi:serine/threonine protein kinase
LPEVRDVQALNDLFEGNYILGDVLGTGGMGTVYSATQVSLRRRVAIKLPHPSMADKPNVSRRFRTEARAGAHLDHPNIARVIDFGGRDGALFLVMEYVGGVVLDKLVVDQGPLEARVAAELVRQLLAALEAAHAAGILHADVKTANLLVEASADAPPHARLIDFGLARFTSESTDHGDRSLSGTPDYLAPELIEGGQPTVASDLYAAGVVLYELLTGSTPFEAVVMRALARDPRDRFVSSAQFADALRATYPTPIGPARIARGTQSSVCSSESVTRDCQRATQPPGATSSHLATEPMHLEPRRGTMHHAVVRHSSDSIVTSCLDLGRALVEAHPLATAVSELEHGLELLRLDEATPRPTMWRLQLCLAASRAAYARIQPAFSTPASATARPTSGNGPNLRESPRHVGCTRPVHAEIN